MQPTADVKGSDPKIEELSRYFSKESGLKVYAGPVKGSHRRHGFYFEKDGNPQYIMDVSLDDMERDRKEVISDLEAAKWLDVLQAHSGKLVPFFIDRRFSAETTFRKWKPKFRHLKRPVNSN